MNKKLIFTVALTTAVSGSVWADEVLLMPNGGTCFRQSGTEVVFGCSGGSNSGNSGNSGNSAADQARVMEAKNARERMKLLEECLRTSDWPGKPGQQECQSMYGK